MVPCKQAPKVEACNDSRPAVAIDPGVRNFLTCYSNDGDGFTVGKDMVVKLMHILRTIDSIDSRLTQATNHAERRRLRRTKLTLYQRYANVRDDYHWKIANFLSSRYGTVLLPRLEVQALAGKLRTKTNREMQASSPYLFCQRLKHKCTERNSVFMPAREDYTTITCGCCGQLNHIGTSTVFYCSCGNVSHRDLHAARNIMLKHLHYCELPPSFLQGMDAYVTAPPQFALAETDANDERVSHLM